MPRLFRSISLHLGLVVTIGMVVVLALNWVADRRTKAAMIVREKEIAQFVTDQMFRQLTDSLTSTTNTRPGDPLPEAPKLDASILFDRQGNISRFDQFGPAKSILEDHIATSQNIADLVKAVLAEHPTQPPLARRGMVFVGGQAFLSVAARVIGEGDSQFAPDPARAGSEQGMVAVHLLTADAERYRALTNEFGFADIEIGAAPKPGKTSIPLYDPSGYNRAQLWWTTRRDDDGLNSMVWPISAAVLVLLIVFQALSVGRWHALERGLADARRKADAAGADSRGKTAFLGSLGHELRTPLNAIIGFSELMRNQPSGDLAAPRIRDYLLDISQSGKKLLRVADDLRHMAEIEFDTILPEDSPSDVNDLLERIVDGFGPQAMAKGISLQMQRRGSAKCRYSGPQLEAIFFHLIENAIKFSETGGSVGVSVLCRDGKIVADVRDNGVGISRPHLEKLGRPFAEMEAHLTRGPRGLGIGLAIAKNIVKLMGGSFSIRSTLGQGTNVRVILPGAKAVTDRATGHDSETNRDIANAA